MAHTFTGPEPQKRLDDLRALGSAYLTTQNAFDAERYPNDEGGGWEPNSHH